MPCSYKASEKETKHTTPLGEGLGVSPVVGVSPVLDL